LILLLCDVQAVPLAAWPVLMEGDGGTHVHSLHVALSRSGFHPGDDDMQVWSDTSMIV
jgi:hypothetical protein